MTHPWAADQMFSTGRFFPGPMIGTPAWITIDLSTMQIANTMEGWGGDMAHVNQFSPFLR